MITWRWIVGQLTDNNSDSSAVSTKSNILRLTPMTSSPDWMLTSIKVLHSFAFFVRIQLLMGVLNLIQVRASSLSCGHSLVRRCSLYHFKLSIVHECNLLLMQFALFVQQCFAGCFTWKLLPCKFAIYSMKGIQHRNRKEERWDQ